MQRTLVKARDSISGIACLHPLMGRAGPVVPQKVVIPSNREHLVFDKIEGSVAKSAKTRYVPEPTLLLLHAIDALQRRCASEMADVARERIGLFVDTGPSYLGIQEEFFRPAAFEGKNTGSPLLFPHTSDASAVSIAAVNFNLRGPCLVVNGGGGSISAANGFLGTRAIDLAIVAAVQYLAPALFEAAITNEFQHSRIPWADCAGAALMRAPLECPVADSVPELECHLGHTGPCRWLFVELWMRHAEGPAD